MMRVPHNPTAYDDDWEDVPAQGFWPMWFGGMAVPLAAVGFAVCCLVTGTATIGDSHGPPMVLRGPQATAAAVALVGVGLFLHCHYFWGNLFHLHWLATLGKIAGLLAFIAGSGYVIVRSFVG
jgi:hypothetical protein